MREKKILFFCHLKNYLNLHIMAEQNNPIMEEVKALLEAEPINAPVISPTVNIPALREQLAILVSKGRCKEAIGTNLTQDQVRLLDEKDVIKYNKRYETYVGSKTNDSITNHFLSLAIKGAGTIVEFDDAEALKNELKDDFIINKELSKFSGGLALKFGSALAIVNAIAIIAKYVVFISEAAVNAAAITAKHVNIKEQITEQSPVITEEFPSNTE